MAASEYLTIIVKDKNLREVKRQLQIHGFEYSFVPASSTCSKVKIKTTQEEDYAFIDILLKKIK